MVEDENVHNTLVILTHCPTAARIELVAEALKCCLVSGMPDFGQKKRRTKVRLLFLGEWLAGGRQAALALAAVASSAAASLPRMNARRIGLITNSAISAAVALSATAITNTACQP